MQIQRFKSLCSLRTCVTLPRPEGICILKKLTIYLKDVTLKRHTGVPCTGVHYTGVHYTGVPCTGVHYTGVPCTGVQWRSYCVCPGQTVELDKTEFWTPAAHEHSDTELLGWDVNSLLTDHFQVNRPHKVHYWPSRAHGQSNPHISHLDTVLTEQEHKQFLSQRLHRRKKQNLIVSE